MVGSLVETLGAAFDDRSVAGVVMQHELVPLAGVGAPVASPTYSEGQRPESTGFVPVADELGWLTGLVADADGRPVTAPLVVLDSKGSQSGRAEAALWERRDIFGGLPGFVVRDEVAVEGGVFPVVLSSWQASHRHVDAWVKFAADPGSGGEPLWAAGGATRDLVRSINSTDDARDAFSYAPNALLYGFFLSNGAVRRHRQARVYSSEVIGWGAQRHYGGAARIDPIPAAADTEIDMAEFGVREKKKDGDKTDKSKGKNKGPRPSMLGMGMVPAKYSVLGHSCERIAARASLSLSLLRGMSYGPDDHDGRRCRAASVALLVLGLAGDALARQDITLRSGCDLVPSSSLWGLRVFGRSVPESLVIEHAQDEQWWAEQVAEALRACGEVGLEFAAPVELTLSGPQRRIVDEGARAAVESAAVDEA